MYIDIQNYYIYGRKIGMEKFIFVWEKNIFIGIRNDGFISKGQ